MTLIQPRTDIDRLCISTGTLTEPWTKSVQCHSLPIHFRGASQSRESVVKWNHSMQLSHEAQHSFHIGQQDESLHHANHALEYNVPEHPAACLVPGEKLNLHLTLKVERLMHLRLSQVRLRKVSSPKDLRGWPEAGFRFAFFFEISLNLFKSLFIGFYLF